MNLPPTLFGDLRQDRHGPAVRASPVSNARRDPGLEQSLTTPGWSALNTDILPCRATPGVSIEVVSHHEVRSGSVAARVRRKASSPASRSAPLQARDAHLTSRCRRFEGDAKTATLG